MHIPEPSQWALLTFAKFLVCAKSAYYVMARDHVVASYCWHQHYRISNRSCQESMRLILSTEISSLSSKIHSKLRSTRSLIVLSLFLSSVGMRLLISHVKNLVIDNGQTWFIFEDCWHNTYREFLHVCPSPDFSSRTMPWDKNTYLLYTKLKCNDYAGCIGKTRDNPTWLK